MKKIKLLTFTSLGCILATPMLSIASCSKSTDQLVQELSDSTIQEFLELSKHPHQSFQLDEMRCYLTNKLNALGYQVMRDNYGNLWFDIPASSGNEKLPRLILQAHYDMVVDGIDESERSYKAVEIVEDKDEDGRTILHSKDWKTTIGADNGIGVAFILAIAKNNSFPHGPIRALLTADEEKGLYGAEALSSAVIDTDFLLNIDGEGDKNNEYVVTRGCAGLCEYFYNKEFDVVTSETEEKILGNKFEIEIRNLKGGHYNDEKNIIYTQNGPQLRANADRFLLEILNKITETNNIQISEFNHKADVGGEDEKFDPRRLPTHARVVFATDADLQTVSDAVSAIYNEFKEGFIGEDWSSIQPTTTSVTSTISSVLSKKNTKDLVKLFGETMPISVQDWEGTTKEEKIKYNYPTVSCNIANFTIKNNENKMAFSIATRGVSGTDEYAQRLTDFFSRECSSLFETSEITCAKDYGPWDAGDKVKMINLVCEGYRNYNIEPFLDRTRGGVEPACFCKKRSTLQQACIGPRIENVHYPTETVWLDTIPPMIKTALYVMANLGKIA